MELPNEGDKASAYESEQPVYSANRALLLRLLVGSIRDLLDRLSLTSCLPEDPLQTCDFDCQSRIRHQPCTCRAASVHLRAAPISYFVTIEDPCVISDNIEGKGKRSKQQIAKKD